MNVILSGLLLAMVGIIWFGVVPIKQVIYEKMRGIQEFYARRENREKQIAKLSEYKGQYDAILQNEKLFDILISEDKIVDFVKTLESLANDTHTELSIASKDNGQIVESKKAVSVKLSQPVSGDPGGSSDNSSTKEKSVDILNDIPFDRYLYLNVKVRGQYGDIVVFLRKMETLPVGLDVVKVEVRKGVVESPSGVALGNGVNPFLASDSNAQAGTTEPVAAKKDIFEAVFDVLVYVKK